MNNEIKHLSNGDFKVKKPANEIEVNNPVIVEHSARVLSSEEVEANRSSAYEYLKFPMLQGKTGV